MFLPLLLVIQRHEFRYCNLKPSRLTLTLFISSLIDSAVYTPADGDNWLLAKLNVQITDIGYAQITEHLAKVKSAELFIYYQELFIFRVTTRGKNINTQFSIEFICNLADRFMVPLKKTTLFFTFCSLFFLRAYSNPQPSIGYRMLRSYCTGLYVQLFLTKRLVIKTQKENNSKEVISHKKINSIPILKNKTNQN